MAFAKDIYVATNGNDTSGDGTITNPYKTFNKAILEMSAGDVCIIRGGVYEQELIINKDGSANNFLTFKAATNENVEIRATSVINGWQSHNGNIYKTTVDMAIDSRFRAIYHNSEYMDLARWPNNSDNNRWTVDCAPVTDGDGSHFTVDNIPDIDWSGGMVYYLGAHSGTSWTRTITSSTTNRIDYTEVDITKWPFTPHNPTEWRDYPGNNRGQLYLFNKLEALDSANEWFYDDTTNTLYLQTANGTIPGDDTVEYARSKYISELNGDYIKLEGLNFFGGSVKIHNNADNNQILNCQIIHGSEGLDDLTNTSAQVGEASIEILGDNTLIKGCTIDHSSVSGIIIAGWAAENCTVEENYISNINYIGIHASPIRTSANYMKVLKNTITNAGRDGMYVAGSNSEVAYNDVSGSQQINSDSGVFYTVGNSNLKNNEIHHNWFHDATAPAYSHNPADPGKAAGIYLDNNSKGYTVHHNVIWNVSWSGYQVNWNNTNLDFFQNTIWNAERAMDSWVNGYTQENNKIYNNFSKNPDWFSQTPTDFDIQDNMISSESPFEDADNQNFMPSSGSAVIDAGREISGFTTTFKGSAPDIGAYERLGTRWTAGVNAIEDTGDGLPISIYDIQFTIESTTETCPDKNNGEIIISADIEDDFIVNFNGNDTSFTKDVSLTDIAPGNYDLCIFINGETEGQCFNFEIKAANQITSKSTLGNKILSVNIEQGTAPYSVYIDNQMVHETHDQSFSIDVNQGDEIKIKSSKDCEGEIIKTIDFYGNIISSPNPTSGDFQFSLPVNDGEVYIEIYDVYARLISSKLYVIESGKINLSLKNQPSGIYFARIMSETPVNVKVIKK
ncbi:T9SS type A sorting domain-containing protein [Tamlana sp. 2_MG-2023]|uniref:right-handed parallel beta-helix repeat-containing protein n=1 Tax=unclassified Tamlana TaxID=2614803 RepID=UPI0026E481D3|nr:MULTISPECIES: right-handed parallel beta-helix repeat-containing protein [unclassified Tamlana]MDO6761267.1 T9SS type A sorting domain-containing protein [Tamlana sp. 2_MG-2023]MDO6791750.1 T9SS type A sorting domain-containing protein [Tamlana sp. 1_MG-2023]